MDFTHILTDPYTQVAAGVMALCMLFLCLYYALFYFRVGRYKGAKAPKGAKVETEPPVSVVITAQNDGTWLKDNLVYLLEQDYPNFEVVVVDYLSTDDTQYVLKIVGENYKHLKTVTIKNNANGYQGKKYPMSMGITSAKNDVLILADPKCMPKDVTNFGWIREMVGGYVHKNIDIVLGFCGIQPEWGLFNWLQQYDNLDYSTEYMGAAIMHRPFTGNGRNLSYRRSFFMKSHGFIYHYSTPDGADDMFVNQNCRRRNTAVVLSEGAFTMVKPMATPSQWHEYRKHRTVTHKYYSFGLKLNRMLRPLSVVLFYGIGIALLLLHWLPWEILAAALLLKLIWQIITTAQATHRLCMKPVIYWLSPLFEIYFLFANTFLAITPLSKPKNR